MAGDWKRGIIELNSDGKLWYFSFPLANCSTFSASDCSCNRGTGMASISQSRDRDGFNQRTTASSERACSRETEQMLSCVWQVKLLNLAFPLLSLRIILQRTTMLYLPLRQSHGVAVTPIIAEYTPSRYAGQQNVAWTS